MKTAAPNGPKGDRSEPTYAWHQSRDFDHIAQALHLLHVDLRQLGSGPFQGEVELVTAGPFLLLRTAVNRVIQARGAVRANTWLISLVGSTNDEAVWRGQRRKRGELNVNAPGSEIDHLSGQPYESVTIGLDVGRLRTAGLIFQDCDVQERLSGIEKIRPSVRSFTALEVLVKRMMTEARSQPTHWQSFLDGKAIEELLMRSLLDALAGESVHSKEATAGNRQRTARRAEEFMLANLRKSLMIGDLCEEVGVSERTLRYAFRDRFGTSPLAYFKKQKLNSIRQQIKSSRTGSEGVQQIAREWGIVHLGNFAADYRRLFGELPSETARMVHGGGCLFRSTDEMSS